MDGSVERSRGRFERCDRAVASFAERSGLACPPGCGACCLSPSVETSVLELRPMAAALVADGRAVDVLARLAAARAVGDARCVLYAPDADDPRRGRCTAYAHRPLVCRLFGFSARRDRLGAPELVACAVMRDALPDAIERARREVRAGAEAPLLDEHVRGLAAEEADAARPLPIDEALRAALEQHLLARRLAALEAEARTEEGDGPGPSRRPSTPRRRRAA